MTSRSACTSVGAGEALLRRAEMGGAPKECRARLESGDVAVDVGALTATRGGSAIRLKPREFDLLAYFMRHPARC